MLKKRLILVAILLVLTVSCSPSDETGFHGGVIGEKGQSGRTRIDAHGGTRQGGSPTYCPPYAWR